MEMRVQAPVVIIFICNIRKRQRIFNAVFFPKKMRSIACKCKKGGKSSFERNLSTVSFYTTSTFSTADVARLKYLCVEILWRNVHLSVCGGKPRVLHKKRECCSG